MSCSLAECSFVGLFDLSKSETILHLSLCVILRWISRAQNKIGLKSTQTVRELHKQSPTAKFPYISNRGCSQVLYFLFPGVSLSDRLSPSAESSLMFSVLQMNEKP